MTNTAVKWYQNKGIQVIFHIITWILFFSLPSILSYNFSSNPDEKERRQPPAGFMIWQERKERMPATPRAENLRQRPGHYNPEGGNGNRSNEMMLIRLISNILLVVSFYVNTFLLIPRLLYRRRFVWYFAAVLLVFLSANIIINLSASLISGRNLPIRRDIIFNLFPFLLVLTASTLYRFIKDKIQHDKMQGEKENQQLKTELSFLRSQISPHFLFNVMNSAVSLARTNSPDLEETLIRISQLLRYMLYESKQEKVSLQKESEYLENYIELQQLRFGDQVDVHFHKLTGEPTMFIEPMLLIPFVENAFKHGISNLSDPEIDIYMEVKGDMLTFRVKNRYYAGNKSGHDANSGIGLPNVRRRLELLYPEKHQLLLLQEDDWFIADLTIYLP